MFGGVVASLRELLPAAFPVVVRAATLPPDTLGCCHRTDARFVIRLAGTLTEQQAIEVLLHEWAHSLAWNHALDRLDSGRYLECERCGRSIEPARHDAIPEADRCAACAASAETGR